MNHEFENLMTPITIGKTTFKNRLFVSPMGLSYNDVIGPFGEYNRHAIEYVGERAKGGFGAMFLGALVPDKEVDPCDPAAHFMNHQMQFMATAAEMNERAGLFGMKVIQQLSLGLGRNYPGLYSCSENPVFGFPGMTSPALTHDQVKKKVESVVTASGLLKASGFTGVEVHALHWGYLMDQFAMAIFNHREDEYGGCLENRLRVVRECVEGIKQVCGSDFLVCMRLGLKSYIKDVNVASFTGDEEAGRTLEEGLRIARLCEEYGYDMLNVDVGTYDSFYHAAPPQYMPKGHVIPLAAEAKKVVNIPVICGSNMNDFRLSESAIAEGKLDAIVVGRASLADPHLAKKLEAGKPEEIRPCIGCQVGCFWKPLSGKITSCAVNPTLFKEGYYQITPAVDVKKVAVIGGGVGGMEAARIAKMRGHDVTIYEKTDVLGGMNIPASSHEFKGSLGQLREWYKRQIAKLDIPVVYNCEMTAEKLRELAPDVAIVGIGAKAVMPPIPGIDNGKACTCVDALNHKAAIGDTVVVVGGGQTGCEIAVDYAMNGKKVTLIEAAADVLAVSPMVSVQTNMMLHDMLAHYGVTVMTNTKISAVTEKGAVVESVASGEKVEIACSNVVMSVGLKPLNSFADELKGSGILVYEIGDGASVGNHYTAIHSAFHTAINL